MVINQLSHSQMMGQGDRQNQPGVGHRAVVGEGNVDAVGAAPVVAPIGCSWFRVGLLSRKPLSPKPGPLSHPFNT